MQDLSPEQENAHNELVKAIENHAKAFGGLDVGWALGDFVICLELIPYDPELVGRQRYAYITPQPSIPLHRILGLLDVIDTDVRAGDPE